MSVLIKFLLLSLGLCACEQTKLSECKDWASLQRSSNVRYCSQLYKEYETRRGECYLRTYDSSKCEQSCLECRECINKLDTLDELTRVCIPEYCPVGIDSKIDGPPPCVPKLSNAINKSALFSTGSYGRISVRKHTIRFSLRFD